MNKYISNKEAISSIRIEDQFFKQAPLLRQHFENRFEDPLKANADRFIWDYWLVKDQYKLLRTPADSFFPAPLYKQFLEHLLSWGRNNLGCQMISHPWLSVYIDGCYQSLHSDVPHGPWSFVYSLTPWATRKFSGGETIIAKPKLLRYFEEITHESSDEKNSLFEQIEPKFNRLTVFDPRYPHGVNRIQGEDNLLKSRLVIHGWFTEPRPMIEGSLSIKKAMPLMDSLAEGLMHEIQNYYGLLSVKLKIAPTGKVSETKLLCGHLVDSTGNTIPENVLGNIIKDKIEQCVPSSKSSGSTYITLPIEFKK